MEEEGLEDIRRTPGERENELHLLGKSRDGRLVRVELSAHGSSTGFAALLERHAELAAASRPVRTAKFAPWPASATCAAHMPSR